jgi:hypothetical protein
MQRISRIDPGFSLDQPPAASRLARAAVGNFSESR